MFFLISEEEIGLNVFCGGGGGGFFSFTHSFVQHSEWLDMEVLLLRLDSVLSWPAVVIKVVEIKKTKTYGLNTCQMYIIFSLSLSIFSLQQL